MVSGKCLCGEVRYEISEPFVSASYCHCTRCQRRTGTAASAQGRIAPGSLRILQGEELVRCWKPEDGFAKCFCSNCGGALWSRNDKDEIASVRLGTVEGDPGISPSYRTYTSYAVVWEPIPDDGLERFPEARSG
jgi:hypothetical protein